VVYVGTTTDPERREQEHRAEGKRFTRLVVTSRRMTEEGAKQKRIEQLETYRRNHEGKSPRYNKD
jgi:predicted GIY-YIG superfamily endonuclease